MDSQQAGINSYRSFVIGQLTQLAINLGGNEPKGGTCADYACDGDD